MWTEIHHLQPVGSHSQLEQAIAVRLQPLAAERGLVAVLGAYDPRDRAEHGRSDSAPPTLRGDQAASAALAVKFVTRAEDIRSQLPALAADRVREMVIIDVEAGTVDWFALVGDRYEPLDPSRLIDCSSAQLAKEIEWPRAGGS